MESKIGSEMVERLKRLTAKLPFMMYVPPQMQHVLREAARREEEEYRKRMLGEQNDRTEFLSANDAANAADALWSTLSVSTLKSGRARKRVGRIKGKSRKNKTSSKKSS